MGHRYLFVNFATPANSVLQILYW